MTCGCECPCAKREREAAERAAADRARYEKSLDDQYASACRHWDAAGKRRLTKSEWMAGCFEEEETPDAACDRRSWPLGWLLVGFAAAAAAVFVL